MAYNNKKVGVICGCHITFCAQNQHLWFCKFPIFKNIYIYPNRFYTFYKCGILRYLFSIPNKSVFSSLPIIHREKLLRQILRYNYSKQWQKKITRTRNHSLFLGLFSLRFFSSQLLLLGSHSQGETQFPQSRLDTVPTVKAKHW